MKEEFKAVLRERVFKGVQLLDRKMPGWRKRIDLERLDMSSLSNCVLAQLCDGDAGSKKADELREGRRMSSLGFDARLSEEEEADGTDGVVVDDVYKFLHDEWVRHITAVVARVPRNKQEWLDDLVRRSRDGLFPAYRAESGECKYRLMNDDDEASLCCAIGALVGDEHYVLGAEEISPVVFLHECGVQHPWISKLTEDEMLEVQSLHDTLALYQWDHKKFVEKLLKLPVFDGMTPTIQ